VNKDDYLPLTKVRTTNSTVILSIFPNQNKSETEFSNNLPID